MTISLWQRPSNQRNARVTKQCDVVIIGGGISGLSAAIELESRGISAIILEAEFTGSKASGRNAGYLIRGAAENYTIASNELGRDTANFLWDWTQQNLNGLKALGIESTPSYANRASCIVSLGEPEHGELVESHRMLLEDGFKAELIEPKDAPSDLLWKSGKPTLGLINPTDAVCSPTELVELLGTALTSTPIYENAEVYRIEDDGNRIALRTRSIDVIASRVMICTNAYADQLIPVLNGIITPNRGQMLAIKPHKKSDARLEFAYYINHGSEYVRSAPDDQIIFGGARTYYEVHEANAADGISDEVQSRLESFVKELLTDEYEVTARWSGIMGFSPDGMPIIGQVPIHTLENKNIWYCGGLTGHGMSMGYITARHAIGVMLDGESTRFSLDRFELSSKT